MKTPRVSLEIAALLLKAGRPWEIELINTEGTSNKFWRACGKGVYDDVKISWGRLHSNGQSILKTMSYVEGKVPAKIRKGYRYRGPTLYNMPPMPPLGFPLSGLKYVILNPETKNYRCLDVGRQVLMEITPSAFGALDLKNRPKIRLSKGDGCASRPMT